MPIRFMVFGIVIVAPAPVVAQESQKPSVTDQQRKSVSDEKTEKIRALIEKTRIRQRPLIDRTRTSGSAGRTRSALAVGLYRGRSAWCERTHYGS